jgi:uncharacterized membrane protein YjgN (DUF898 family)
MSEPAAVQSDDSPVRLEQRAVLSSFLGLSLKNGLLNLVTLTLYRFWGKTEVRRRLWSSIHLNDEPFEYTGRGKELFLGFLFALGVIGLPFLVVVFSAQFLAPAYAGLILLPFYVFLSFLLGYGRFTAFRYIASRSSWRGVRFQLTGSPASYGRAYLGYVWLSAVTLGWFWPAANRRLAGPLWEGLRFGDRPFRYRIEDARKEHVYGAYALGWVGGVVGYIAMIGAMMAILVPAMKDEAGNTVEPSLAVFGQIYVLVGALALAYAVIFSPYQAAMLRSIAAGIGFDEVRFKMRVNWYDMAWMTLSNLALLTVSLGFLMPFVEARVSRFLFSRLETSGAVDLDSIGQAASAGPRTGEGLADAFGVSPI